MSTCSCPRDFIFAVKGATSDTDGICLCLLFRCCFSDLAGTDLIKFGIESKRSCGETCTEAFIDAIALALHDMRDVCVGGSNPARLTTRL